MIQQFDFLICTQKKRKHFYLKAATKISIAIVYFGHLTQRTDSLEKILILGKTEGRRRKG